METRKEHFANQILILSFEALFVLKLYICVMILLMDSFCYFVKNGDKIS